MSSTIEEHHLPKDTKKIIIYMDDAIPVESVEIQWLNLGSRIFTFDELKALVLETHVNCFNV